MDIILIAGLWLANTVWDPTRVELEQLGHRVFTPELPGVDDGSTTATLADQLDAVTATVDRARSPLLVGHSAATTLAWMAADRRRRSVSGVAMMGGLPKADGERYVDSFGLVEEVLAFPGWEVFDEAEIGDLDGDAQQMLAANAVPVLAEVANATVTYTDPARFELPAVLVCTDEPVADVQGWIDGGAAPEMDAAENVLFIAFDVGHWPMVSAPTELAHLIDATTVAIGS